MAEDKKVKNRKLGKGLDAIFGESHSGADLQAMINAIEKQAPQMSQISVNLSEIRPNPYQPRKHFDQEKLDELAQSIQEHGVFQPILLKESIHGYEIVAGERRYRAAKQVGLETIPSIIIELTDDEMMEIALLENIQRENLNAIEEAKAYKVLQDKFSLTQEELAQRVGKSRAHVANTLRLLTISETLQNYVLDGKLSMGHVRPLVGLDEGKALTVAKRAINENLSVRQVEDIVKGIKLSQNRASKPKKEKRSEYTYAESLLRKKYRTRVKIEDKSIRLRFTDADDLNRLLELMGVLEDV